MDNIGHNGLIALQDSFIGTVCFIFLCGVEWKSCAHIFMSVKSLFLFIRKKAINLHPLISHSSHCNTILFISEGKIVNASFKPINLISIKGTGSLNEDNNILQVLFLLFGFFYRLVFITSVYGIHVKYVAWYFLSFYFLFL